MLHPAPQKILGAVLAGGRSSRFGTDKGIALLDGRPLIVHAIEALQRHTDAVIICGREWSQAVAIPDRPSADLGPLGGLNAALRHAQRNGFDRVLTVGCDTPELPDQLLEELANQPGSAIVETIPIIGIWESSLANALDRHLEQGDDRSVKKWARSAGARFMPWQGSIPNINTVAELEAISKARGEIGGH